MRDNVVICQKCREGKQRKKESNTKRTASARMASLDSRKKQKQLSASTSQHGSIAQQTIASNDGLPLLSPFYGPQQNPVASTSIQQKQQPSASFQLDEFPSTSTHWGFGEQEEDVVEGQEEEIEEVENQEESRFYDNLASRIIPIESLLILSDNNSNLVNKQHEYNNFLRFIEYRPTGIEDQVAHLHTLAVKFLVEQWNVITWVPFERT
uniref:Uncharacterized protein n=1 Tax=Meloidogyne floridensis TaxID=298350 RepID=A0A915NJN6_9BILA